MVGRFNQRGLTAVLIAPRCGRKEISTPLEQERIREEFRLVPDREEDATTTWLCMMLRQALRKQALPGPRDAQRDGAPHQRQNVRVADESRDVGAPTPTYAERTGVKERKGEETSFKGTL